jgi:putative transposase
MYNAVKVQLKPTAEQKKKLEEFANIARFVYNKSLDWQNLNYAMGGSYINKYEMRDRFVDLKDMLALFGETWLKECNADVIAQAAFDCGAAFQKFFDKLAGYPKFKSKYKSKLGYFNDPRKLKFDGKSVLLTKIGYVKTTEEIPERKYVNPRVTYDGKYWYLSLGYEITDIEPENNTGEAIGIDLGIKDFAVCSNGMIIANINKSEKVRKIEKKLKRRQRERSRRVKKGKNRAKTNKQARLLHRKLHNIREDHINQAIAKAVKAKPHTIVVEDLNIKGLLLNGKLSRAISQQLWGRFLVKLENKCLSNQIKLMKADRMYASTQICSSCGNRLIGDEKLTLKDRTYKCKICGLELDRDFNASLNLKKLAVI